MSSWVIGSGGGPVVLVKGDLDYRRLFGSATLEVDEASTQIVLRDAFAASNLMCNVTAIVGTLTVTSRKNGAAGGQSLSITTTGQKEDTSGSDALIDGDLLTTQLAMSGSHSDTASVASLSMLLDDGGTGSSVQVASCSVSFGTTGPQFFKMVGQISIEKSPESRAQHVVRAAAVFSNLSMYFTTNTFSTPAIFKLRINGVDGNMALSVPAGITGRSEALTSSDAVAAGSLVCLCKTLSGTSGGGTASLVQLKVASSISLSPLIGSGTTTTSNPGTAYQHLGGATAGSATESLIQVKARIVDVWRNLQINIYGNTLNGSSTFHLRANAASPVGAPAISIGSGVSGIREDLTGTYTSAATDLLNYRLVAGGSTGSMLWESGGVMQGAPPAPTKAVPPFHRPLRIWHRSSAA